MVVLDKSLSKHNIKNMFKATLIWPFNPKVMDDKTRPRNVYTTIPRRSNEEDDNSKAFDDNQQFGEFMKPLRS